MKFLLILLALLLVGCDSTEPPHDTPETTASLSTEPTTESDLPIPSLAEPLTLRERIIADDRLFEGANFFTTPWLEYLDGAFGEPKLLYGFSHDKLASGLTLHSGVWDVPLTDGSSKTYLAVEVESEAGMRLSYLDVYLGEPKSLTLAEVAAIVESDPRFVGTFDFSEPKSNEFVTVHNLTREGELVLGERYEHDLATTSADGRFTAERTESADLYVIDTRSGARTLVAKGNFDANALGDFRNPLIWRFVGNKLYYQIVRYESSGGVYVYDCESGENERLSYFNPIGMVNGDVYTASHWYTNGEQNVYYLGASGEIPLEWVGHEPDFAEEFGNIILDERTGELLMLVLEDGKVKFLRYRLDGAVATLTQSAELDDRLCSPQYLSIEGGTVVVRCERHAGCEEYMFVIKTPDL